MRKKLGINIDGIIRDHITQFEKVYISTFISNPSLVDADEDFANVKVLTGEEEKIKAKIIEDKIKSMITKPIDSFDLMNHFKFEDGKNYLGFDKTAEELFDEFVNEIKAFKIYGEAPKYPSVDVQVHNLQQIGMQEDLFDVVLLSTLQGKAIMATYSFLAYAGIRVKELRFVNEDYEKWEYCDALIDIMPEALQSKPEDGLVIKIEKEFNKWDENVDMSYGSLRDACSDPEFIENIKEFFKKKKQ